MPNLHRPGVARRPLTFFASPKKVSKERRPRCHCPSGAQLCESKNGKASKLASLRQRSFLYPFSASHNWQCQKWMKVKINSKTKNKTKTKSNNCRKQFERPLILYVLILPHVQMPIAWMKNGIKRCNCLSEASCLHRPIFRPRNWEPEGRRYLRRLLLLTFLGEARKVSGCRVTPDLQTS